MSKYFNEKDVHDQFESYTSKGYSEADAEKVMNNENEIRDKVKNNGALSEYLELIILFFMMLKDFFAGRYPAPKSAIIAIIGTLLYVLSPIDIVPDFIPFIGYLDDAAMIAICYRLIESDVEDYKIFKEEEKRRIYQ